MQIARDATKSAIELLLFDNRLDRINRGCASVPDGLRMVITEILDQFSQTRIGYVGEVRSRVTSVDHGDAVPLNQRNTEACVL